MPENKLATDDTERQERATDPLYDVRTHLTDATLAADLLCRTDAERTNPKRRRVHRYLKRAHKALRADLARLDPAHTDPSV